MKNPILLSFVLILATSTTVNSAEIIVDANGFGDYPTIQAAIDASVNGDTIILTPGRYTGDDNRDIDYLGKAITVRSTDPNDPNIVETTIIDCNTIRREHRGFEFHLGEDANSVLNGLTITKGYAKYGGGINCKSASPLLINCSIIANVGKTGGGIYCADSNAIIINCNITDNSAPGGGGIFSTGGKPTIIKCKISRNLSLSPHGIGRGAGIRCYRSSPTITNCIFSGNTAGTTQQYAGKGGAIFCNKNSNPIITNCTIVGNSALMGNALACDSSRQEYPSNPQLRNCILTNDSNEIWNNDNSTIDIIYSDIQGTFPGQGNIDSDPCFIEPGYWDPNGTPADANDDFWVEGDYHLLQDSLCINTGDPNYIPEPNEADLDGMPRIMGGRIDMGAYEFAPSIPPLEVKMKCTPQTLNCNSKGNLLKAHITLPEGFSADDVSDDPIVITYLDGDSVIIEIESHHKNVFTNDNGLVEIEATFSRQAFCESFSGYNSGEITAFGSLTTGHLFYAYDTIKIKNCR